MKSTYHTCRLVLGDQLNPQHSWFKEQTSGILYVMMEIKQETDYTLHHIQKLLAFFAAMREFKRYLKSKNFSIHYIDLDDRENTQSLSSNLKKILNHYSVSRFEYIQPDEYRLDEQLRTFCQTLSTPSKAVSAEHFLTSRTDLQDHFKNKKSILMESFYRMMRKRFNILMENDSPAGGRWNYDSENRKKYDGDAQIPQPQQAAKAPPHRLCLPAVGQIFAKR